jgi:PAS domain S-box-containing protein
MKAEQELQRSLNETRAAEAKWRAFLEAAPNAIVIINQEGRIEVVNAQAEKLFGYTRAELLGQPVEILVPERFRGDHLSHRAGYISDPRARPMGAGLDLYARRKDGSEFPVEISLNPVHMSEGMLVTSIISDITKRKQAEEELKQTAAELARSNTELEEFAYVASHDLQEPLRMVVSYLQLLKRRYHNKLDPNADEFIGFAVDGAFRMQTLINDLLSYSRVGTRGKPFAPTDCQEVLNRTLDNLRASITESVAVINSDALPVILADDVQLGQLFQNLIGNAIKFRAAEPPRVHISAKQEANDWVFAISDNGIGISAEYSERIFKVFQRLHGREEYPGTGIGLAICKKIVERHGGRIWVESKLGQGATFYFTIPSQGGNQR